MSWETGPMYSGPAPKRKPKRVRRPRDCEYLGVFTYDDRSHPLDQPPFVDVWTRLRSPSDIRRLAAWLAKAADWIDAKEGKA